jgi:hypothetical protein
MTSRMHLKHGRSTGNGAYMQKGPTSRVMVASRPKEVSDQMAVQVPEIMDIICKTVCRNQSTQCLQELCRAKDFEMSIFKLLDYKIVLYLFIYHLRMTSCISNEFGNSNTKRKFKK